MTRTRLLKKFLKGRINERRALYNRQRNICVSLSRTSKKTYISKLDNKILIKRLQIILEFLIVKENINSFDRQLANAFSTFFGDIVKNLKVQKEENSHEIIFNNPDPSFNSTEKHQN